LTGRGRTKPGRGRKKKDGKMKKKKPSRREGLKGLRGLKRACLGVKNRVQEVKHPNQTNTVPRFKSIDCHIVC
jgi:hypothetical protein